MCIYAAAGMAAHLSFGAFAKYYKTIIGVPMKGGAMDGMDAMLSTVQMPAGMPVATVALGKSRSCKCCISCNANFSNFR